jgi:N6-adenosine-specific RNA methylase IME4
VKYRTIVADPPWTVARTMGAGGRRRNRTEIPYAMLDVDAIAALDVGRFAHPSGCWLFLWATRRLFRHGIAVDVARAWGFEDVGELVWGLRNPGLGVRGGIANDHEPVLIARRGAVPLEFGSLDAPLGVHFWRQVYEHGAAGVPQKVHSAKPDGFLDFVESIAPGPYLELFARRQRLGWDTWGNEALEHVELTAAP